MEAATQASTKSEAFHFRRRCHELIVYAEKLKLEANPRSSVEESILSDASKLHGNFFPCWKENPRETEFQAHGDGLFRYVQLNLRGV